MKKKDYIAIITIVIFVMIVFIIWKITFSESGSEVYISVDNTEVFSAGLYEDCLVEICDEKCRAISNETEYSGKGNLLIIKDGYADMLEADCRDHICVNMKSISKVGESIVCMPNKVVVSVR